MDMNQENKLVVCSWCGYIINIPIELSNIRYASLTVCNECAEVNAHEHWEAGTSFTDWSSHYDV
jgi:ribosome-binding protein aMBF1 (putative translation factor)